MKNISLLVIAVAAALPLSVSADPDKRRHGREHKEEYWDGRCKVERKWDKHGSYKEKRKCKPDAYVRHAPPPVVVQPQPVYVKPAPMYVQPAPVYVQPAPVYVQPAPVYVQPAPAPAVVIDPGGVTIQGTVRLK